MPTPTTAVSLRTIRNAATTLKRHVSRADQDGDGRLTLQEARAYGRAVKNDALGKALATMTSFARHRSDSLSPSKPGAKTSDVRGAIDSAVELISARDVDANRRLEGKELTRANKLETFKALAELARRLEQPK